MDLHCIRGKIGRVIMVVLLQASIVWTQNQDDLQQTYRGLKPMWVTSADNTSKLMLGNDTLSFRPIHDDNAPFAVSQYSITCCRNGTPQADPSLAPYIHEWSQEMVGVERNKTCRRFNGYYSVPTWVMQQQKKLVVGVRCKCPDDGNLDRNCRYLPDCANGGYRSFSINLHCVCPPKWFGDLCEKFCLNGELYKDFASPSDDGLGIDRCKCMKNFYGEACDEVHCFNGGTPVRNRGCLCMQPYVGPHCEEVAGVIGQYDGPTSTSFHRDLSSTIVSLFLAVALALGVYYLVRRRTQWMRRRLRARRTMMMGGVDESGNPYQASPIGLTGPPPTYYTANNPQPTNGSADTVYGVVDLPPPPAYSDVVKVLPSYMDTRSQPGLLQMQPDPVPFDELNNNASHGEGAIASSTEAHIPSPSSGSSQADAVQRESSLSQDAGTPASSQTDLVLSDSKTDTGDLKTSGISETVHMV